MKKIIVFVMIFVLMLNTYGIANATDSKSFETDNVPTAKIEEESSQERIEIKELDLNDERLIKYQNKFSEYLKRNKKGTIYKDSYFITFEKFKAKESKKQYIIQELNDGDFVVLPYEQNQKSNYDEYPKFKKEHFDVFEALTLETPSISYETAYEYHKDGNLMGIIKIVPVFTTKKEVTIAFYEYRLTDSNNEKNKYDTVLKHIQILNIEKHKKQIHFNQFIYRNEKFDDNSDENQFKLIAYRIDNDFYVAKDEKNLIKNIDGYGNDLFINKRKYEILNGIGGLGHIAIAGTILIAASPIWIPLMGIFCWAGGF